MNLTLNAIYLFQDSTQVASKIIQSGHVSNGEPISIYVQIILASVILIIGTGLFFYFLDLMLKYFGVFKNPKGFMKENYFVIFLMFPVFYLLYYYAYYLPNIDDAKDVSIFTRRETSELLKTASLAFLGTGALTGTLKWLNNLVFFKKQFSEIIKSKDFSDVLSDKMKDLALSDNYLLQRNDLEDIWKRVTICKYQQKFPELSEEIQKKIENDLYLEKSLSYYYKNFRVQINFSLDGDIIKIVEISSLTVIADSTDKIEINFGTTAHTADNELVYSKIVAEGCKCDGQPLELQTVNENEYGGLDDNCTRFKAELSGKKKYVIERQVELTQDIKEDRVFAFSSSRIIDDLSVNLKYDSGLKLFFSPVGKNIFDDDNHVRSEQSATYITRDLLLPGEKFKVFIYKKG